MSEPEDIFSELDAAKPKRQGEDRAQADARLALLRAILFGVGTEGDGQLFLRTLSKLKNGTSARTSGPEFFSADPEAVSARAMAESRKGYNVYVGGSPRYPNENGAISGKKESCIDGHMLWADCDTDDSLDRLAEFPIEPTFLIHSGGETETGRPNAHAWWTLDEPLPWQEIERLNTLIIEFLGTQEKGNVKDASRVLRLPGTLHQDSGRQVECVSQNGGVRVRLLREALEATHEGVEKATEESPRPEGRSTLTDLRANPPVGEGSGRSNWLIQVVGHLVHQYDDYATLTSAIRRENSRLSHPLADDELEDTVFKSARRYFDRAHERPPIGADEKAKLAELTNGWCLPSTVRRVEIWGKRPDSPCDVYLEDGTKINIQEVGAAANQRTLCQILIAQTKGACPGPTKAKAVDILRYYQVLWQLANEATDHDDRAEVIEWVQSFLTDAEIKTDWTMADQAEKYAATCALQARKWDPLSTVAPMVVRDRETGEILLKSTDLRSFVYRRYGTSIDSTKLKARALQAGYDHRVLRAWPAGYGRVGRESDPASYRKVAVYVLPGETS